MATLVRKAIRSAAAWTANQTAMEAIYGVGGYYTTLSAFDAALPDLTSTGEKWQAECYDDWPSGLVDSVQFINITTDRGSDEIVVVKVADGEGHTGIADGFFMTGYIRIANIDIDIEGVRLTGNTAYNSAKIDLTAHSTGQANLTRMYIHDSTAYGVGHVGSNSGWQVTHSTFNNTNFAVRASSSGSTALIADVTAVNCGTYGFIRCLTKNCLSYGHTTADYFAATSGSDYNAGSDTTAPGVNSVDSIASSVFANYAGDDFHLDSGASTLIGAGDNLITATTLSSPQYDIDGEALPGDGAGAWDIGSDHYVSASGITVTGTLETLTLTEFLAIINAGTNVTGTLETLTFTGYQASVSIGTNIAGTLETLTLTEYPATVNAQTNVSGTLETLTLTEYPATITEGAVTNVTGTLETLTLTEYPSVISYTTAVYATLETLTLTTFKADISYTSLEVDEDNPTGGWDYPQRPSKKETKKQREELGIIEPDKLIKPVKTARKIPVDFAQIKSLEQAEQQRAELKELQRLHETIKRRGIKKAQKEQLDREVLIKITLALNMLEQQKQLIEEQDIVFVMMMLAA